MAWYHTSDCNASCMRSRQDPLRISIVPSESETARLDCAKTDQNGIVFYCTKIRVHDEIRFADYDDVYLIHLLSNLIFYLLLMGSRQLFYKNIDCMRRSLWDPLRIGSVACFHASRQELSQSAPKSIKMAQFSIQIKLKERASPSIGGECHARLVLKKREVHVC